MIMRPLYSLVFIAVIVQFDMFVKLVCPGFVYLHPVNSVGARFPPSRRAVA